MERLSIRTNRSTELVDITGQVQEAIARLGGLDGVVYLFCPHTTAGLTLNENADPSVCQDILETLEKLVPWRAAYRHTEGNAAAHVKSSLVGHSLLVPVENGRLALGTWQGIFLCEFDGPRSRRVWVQVLPAMDIGH